LLKTAEFFLAEMKAQRDEEYCWAITEAAGRSRCSPSGSSVLEFGYIYVYLYIFIYIFFIYIFIYLLQKNRNERKM